MDMSDDEDNDQVATAVEEEEVVIISALPRKSSSRGRACKRRSAMESWLPLASFIDLREDDSPSWNWRNFIEIGGVS